MSLTKTLSAVRNRFKILLHGYPALNSVLEKTTQSTQIESDRLRSELLRLSRYDQPRCLTRSGFKVFSQFSEDGILDEIFRRIGTTNRFFVEFGVGDGMENNTLYKLGQGWDGIWFDGDHDKITSIRRTHDTLIASKKLRVYEKWILSSTVMNDFRCASVPTEFDLLSIDIDGNDYWVWKALEEFSPRVVVIEFNAGMGPSLFWTMPDGSENAS